MKILAYQPLIGRVESIEERQRHVRRMIRFVEERYHQEPDIDLIILPELSTISYSSASFKQLSLLAEPLMSETFGEMAALARRIQCAISYGFPRVKNGAFYISQMVVDQSGHYLTHYDKIHLAQFGASPEQEYFSGGQKLCIFEIGEFRFGIIICYDFRFSELIKRLVDDYQIDVLLHPVAFTRDDTYESWHHFVICRALENQIYFLSINQAGRDWGGSIFCPPWIDKWTKPTILGEAEEACTYTLEKAAIYSARETYPFRQDKLPDYSVLTP